MSIDDLLKTLNKITGSLIAAVLYPLKALLTSVLLILAVLPVTLAKFIGEPILEISEAEDVEHFMIRLFCLFVALLLVLPITVVLIGVLLCLAVYDCLHSLVFGVIDGYNNGLSLHIFKRTFLDFTCFSIALRILTDKPMTLIEATPAPAPAPAPAQVIPGFEYLNNEELQIAQGMDGALKLVQRYKQLNLIHRNTAIHRRENSNPNRNNLEELIQCTREIRALIRQRNKNPKSAVMPAGPENTSQNSLIARVQPEKPSLASSIGHTVWTSYEDFVEVQGANHQVGSSETVAATNSFQ
jgi:uncharacterized membrane protein